MSQPDYPHSQDSGKLQTLAIQMGKMETALEGIEAGIEEMKASLASISHDRLQEARDYGSLTTRVSTIEGWKADETKWRYALVGGIVLAIALRFMK